MVPPIYYPFSTATDPKVSPPATRALAPSADPPVAGARAPGKGEVGVAGAKIKSYTYNQSHVVRRFVLGGKIGLLALHAVRYTLQGRGAHRSLVEHPSPLSFPCYWMAMACTGKL